LIVRLLPAIWQEDNEPYSEILKDEGYELNTNVAPYRTILMDIRSNLEELERGLHPKWRKHLNRARRNNLEVLEGEDDTLFVGLDSVYQEMIARKKFSGGADISSYRAAQEDLAPHEKMRVILCKEKEEIVAGAMFSAIGDTGVDLFRATSNRGVTTYGSYLVQWRVLVRLKEKGCMWYNLNGVNPSRNPGGYQFKSQLAGKFGRDVYFLGPFDAYPGRTKKTLMRCADTIRAMIKQRGLRRPNGEVPPQKGVTQETGN